MQKTAKQSQTFAPTSATDLAQRADAEPVEAFPAKYFVGATGLGAFPGKDMPDAIFRIRGELGEPHLAYLPELADRGFAATSLARTICCLEGLTADGTASGWRLRTGRSQEYERAFSLFASDINILADIVGQEKSKSKAPFKIQLMGPISLAASLYSGKGELLLADHGARRDLVQSLLEGVQPWLKSLEEALQGTPLVLQLVEPYLADAMKGKIPTSSGYQTHRSIPLQEVEATFSAVAQGLKPQVDSLVFQMPTQLQDEVYREADGLIITLANSSAKTWENIAFQIENDKKVILGIQNPLQASSALSSARWFIKNFRTVGLPYSALSQVSFTETGDLDKVAPEVATTVLHHLTEISGIVAELAAEGS